MSETKWGELVSEMRSIAQFMPRYRQKHVRASEAAGWDSEWFYHLRPYSVIEWLDIDSGDHTPAVEAALRKIHVPFSREGSVLRVWGYIRPGTHPEWS